MSSFASYVICSTPRSGSTLLCEMLAATGVSGKPNSYFRQPSVAYFADLWGVDHTDGTETVAFDRAYLTAMLREGRSETDVFGLRVMWSSVGDAERRLNRIYDSASKFPALIERAFGPTLYIALSRRDKLAQAVSLVRAEQSGLWHLSADGSILEGTVSPQPVRYDPDRIAAVFRELNDDDAAWAGFFAKHEITPLTLTYEGVTANPQQALAQVLTTLGQDPAIAATIPTKTAKLPDITGTEWANRFRRETGLRD